MPNPVAAEPLLQAVLHRSASTAAAEATEAAHKRRAPTKRPARGGTRRAKTASPPPSSSLEQRLRARAEAASPEILAHSETPAGQAALKARVAELERALVAKTQELDDMGQQLADAKEKAAAAQRAAAAELASLHRDLGALAGAVAAAVKRVDAAALLLR